MTEALKRAEAIIEDFRAVAKPGSKLEKQCDELELLCRGYMAEALDVDEVMGRPTPLTGSEYRLFCLLHRRVGNLVSTDALMDALYFDDPEGGAEPGTLDVIIFRLGKKLEGSRFRIENVRAQGYKMVDALLPDRKFFDCFKNVDFSYAAQFQFTETEGRIFNALYTAKGDIVPLANLLTAAFGSPSVSERRIYRYFSMIRTKLENAPFLIVNEAGKGYRLVYSQERAKARMRSPIDVASKLEERRQSERARSKAYRARRSIEQSAAA